MVETYNWQRKAPGKFIRHNRRYRFLYKFHRTNPFLTFRPRSGARFAQSKSVFVLFSSANLPTLDIRRRIFHYWNAQRTRRFYCARKANDPSDLTVDEVSEMCEALRISSFFSSYLNIHIVPHVRPAAIPIRNSKNELFDNYNKKKTQILKSRYVIYFELVTFWIIHACFFDQLWMSWNLNVVHVLSEPNKWFMSAIVKCA